MLSKRALYSAVLMITWCSSNVTAQNCEVTNELDCTRYTLCIECDDRTLYPGRTQILEHDVYIPLGLTPTVYLSIETPDSVVVSNAYITFQNDSLDMSFGNGYFTSNLTKSSATQPRLIRLSSHGRYNFGDMFCNESDISTAPTAIPTSVVTAPTVIPTSVSTASTVIPTSVATASTVIPTSVATASTVIPTSIAIASTVILTSVENASTVIPTSVANASTVTPHTGNLCTYCLIRLTVEFLLANIKDVPDNSSVPVTAKLVSGTEELAAITSMVVLRTIQNFTEKSNMSTNIPDLLEFPVGSVKQFRVHIIMGNLLSAYKAVLHITSPLMRIASVRVAAVGDHLKGIIATEEGKREDDYLFCDPGPDTRTRDFGYIPNTGADDDNSPLSANTVELEVTLHMTEQANTTSMYSLNIIFELDFSVMKTITKTFKATPFIPLPKLNIRTNYPPPSIAKGGGGTLYFVWEIPSLSSGLYQMSYASRRIAGPGGDEMVIPAVKLLELGYSSVNLPCTDFSKFWKPNADIAEYIINIPYSSRPGASDFGFELVYVMQPDIVDAGSSYELTVDISYHESTQTFHFYLNVSDEELFTKPDENGNLPFQFIMDDACDSVTTTTDIILSLSLLPNHNYGRMLVEIPVSNKSGEALVISRFKNIWKGRNVFGDFTVQLTRRDDGMIESALVDMSPLTTFSVVPTRRTDDQVIMSDQDVNMRLTVTFTDSNITTSGTFAHFEANIISNGRIIDTEPIGVGKPNIEYFPELIVVTEITKSDKTETLDMWFHHSLDGVTYQKEKLTWKTGSDVHALQTPAIAAYFYLSEAPLHAVCDITTVWLPLKHYITIVEDNNHVLHKKLPYILDEDLNTCLKLPVPGESPSMFWMTIRKLSLFDARTDKLGINITGENIECQRVGVKSVQVATSGPITDQCDANANLLFCKFVSRTTNITLTRCDVECRCADQLQCSYLHVVLQSANTDPWSICELKIRDL